MTLKITERDSTIINELLAKVCQKYSGGPLCNKIEETGSNEGSLYIVNGVRDHFIITKRDNPGTGTERYSIHRYFSDKKNDVREPLFRIAPAATSIGILGGCDGSAAPAITMEPLYIDVKIEANTADGSAKVETPNININDTEGEAGKEDVHGSAEPKPDAADETSGPTDAEVSAVGKDAYETPLGAEETWQSKFESLGLCYNEFSTCKIVTASPCWFINKMNGSKPDTLAFIDPELTSIDLKLEGGPLGESGMHEFIRVDEGVVMDNGFFNSAIWLADDVQIVADFVGITVDVLFIKTDMDADIGSCEYAYNYPCSDDGICNP